MTGKKTALEMFWKRETNMTLCCWIFGYGRGRTGYFQG